jgi:uncharacterized protein (TIGR00255 family)
MTMVRSMTGFGRGHTRTERYAVSVEARSVNNRNLRAGFRLPDRLQGLEAELEKLVRDAVSRGTVNVSISLDDLTGDPGYILDPAAIRYYDDALRTLRRELGAAEEPPLSVLVTLPGVVRKSKTAEDVPEELWNAVRQALEAALRELVAAREREGKYTWEDMMSRCRAIGVLLGRVEARVPQMVEDYRRRLSERLGKLLQGVGTELAEEDLRKEIAMFADRSDISEEISRLRSHLALMEKATAAGEPYGRKLEFITQEMFREANTMASKAAAAEMVSDLIDIKSEIEKLREQALNVE